MFIWYDIERMIHKNNTMIVFCNHVKIRQLPFYLYKNLTESYMRNIKKITEVQHIA